MDRAASFGAPLYVAIDPEHVYGWGGMMYRP